ncbi:MAG: putative quinol monooxygenase [Salibacteraceae bacterium]
MITRIVKMTFEERHTAHFWAVMNEVHDKILATKGCRELRVFHAVQQPEIVFTISSWNNVDDLENYRKSELFKQTWSTVKPLFKSKAEAWTLVENHTAKKQ